MKLSKSGRYIEFKGGKLIGIDTIFFAVLFVIFVGVLITRHA